MTVFGILLIIAFVVIFSMVITFLSLVLIEFIDDILGTNFCERIGEKLGGKQ